MPTCPFPGMDPYLEDAWIWPDFHDRLIFNLSEVIQPLLRPRYVALAEASLYVVNSERSIRPDLTVIQSSWDQRVGTQTDATAVMEPDAALVVRESTLEARVPYLQIMDLKNNNRIVTVIEILSTDNKSGTGRKKYLEKPDEIWNSETNLVELDFLRQGQRVVWVPPERLAPLGAFHYLVSVKRSDPWQSELYGFTIRDRFPRIRLPLADDDSDLTLDLAVPFRRCWESGPYQELIKYNGPPPGELSPEDAAWAQSIAAGLAAGDSSGR